MEEVTNMATILVTGANRGIGLALTQQLEARGDDVFAACRHSSPELDALAKAPRRGSVHIETGIDLGVDEVVQSLHNRLGKQRFNGLILNAGILRRDNLEALDLASLREQFEVNALGPARVISALRGTLEPGAKVALITSRMGSISDNSSGGSYGYRMSKAALNAFGASLAHDLKPAQVSVAILHPGFVKTDMTSRAGNATPEEAARMLLARIDALTLGTTGQFLHANGEPLPW
jgi:NAD(P)-dependent dehydrogenase (short-subunit alcohol dehydrogenase family)